MADHLKYLVLLFPVAGAFMFIAGLVWQGRLKAKAEGCLRIYGTVVGSVKQCGDGFGPSPAYRPIVEFFVRGQRFSVTSDVGSGQEIKEGTKTEIMYNPANPAIAFLVRDYYKFANMLLGIGGGLVGLGSLTAYQILCSSK